MEEEHRSEGALRDTAPEPRYRGSNNMYRGVTISVKALTGAILGRVWPRLRSPSCFLRAAADSPLRLKPTAVPRCPRRPAATASWSGVPEDPVKEGYVFDGWYWDVEREHRPWDFAQDTVEDSMYLYARWQPVP